MLVEATVSAVRKAIERHAYKKIRAKLSLFTSDVIVCGEIKPKEYTKKLLKLISQFCKVIGYKINI